MNIAVLSTALGVIAAIAGGVYFVEDRYVTNKRHDNEIAANQDNTRDYLLDLRIEQYEQWEWHLMEQEEKTGLTTQEKRKLERIEDRIEKLHQIKETL